MSEHFDKNIPEKKLIESNQESSSLDFLSIFDHMSPFWRKGLGAFLTDSSNNNAPEYYNQFQFRRASDLGRIVTPIFDPNKLVKLQTDLLNYQDSDESLQSSKQNENPMQFMENMQAIIDRTSDKDKDNEEVDAKENEMTNEIEAQIDEDALLRRFPFLMSASALRRSQLATSTMKLRTLNQNNSNQQLQTNNQGLPNVTF